MLGELAVISINFLAFRTLIGQMGLGMLVPDVASDCVSRSERCGARNAKVTAGIKWFHVLGHERFSSVYKTKRGENNLQFTYFYSDDCQKKIASDSRT